MKTAVACWMLPLILSATKSSFPQQPRASLTVRVENLRNSEGDVLISVYDNKEKFPKDAKHAVGKARVAIVDGSAVTTFRNLKHGAYAVAILHDENRNLKMDFNAVGMPREGYGFSNNVRGKFGPPPFEKAAFRINAPRHDVQIRASYFLK
jgi:uncharacterized protein (DUF2141 family)